MLDLEPEEKEGMLRWARAHVLLMQVFGQQQQMQTLHEHHDNAYHFTRLAELAVHVDALSLSDEAAA